MRDEGREATGEGCPGQKRERSGDGPEEDRFTSWLAACDDAVAQGSVTPTLPEPAGASAQAREYLDCFQLLRQVLGRGARGEGHGAREEGRGGSDCLSLSSHASPLASHPSSLTSRPLSLAPHPSPLPWTSLGRFQFRRELGRGGFGIVFLAYDPLLGREVALKVPHAGAALSPDLRERFLREGRAASGLDHPNLVAVHEAGAIGPVCFIVSAYCPGTNLAHWLRERRDPVPFRTAAELVAALAKGVQHAHERGVLHRDLKPANIVLMNEHEAATDDTRQDSSLTPAAGPPPPLLVPRITDFGLAKLVAGPEDQTRSGAVLGTPSYMAPEQAAGKSRQAGPAADIYSLGAILYELLTGRAPFRGETDLDTLLQVQATEPVPPARLRPKVPRDLETICLKCLHKEPRRRYGSAQELGDDLERFLAGAPIRGRPVARSERLFKWIKRHPALAGVYSLLIVVLVLGLGGGGALFLWQQAEAARAEAETQKAAADTARALARRILYGAQMLNAGRDCDEGNLAAMRLRLEPFAEAADLHHFEWHYNRRRLVESEHFFLRGHTHNITRVAVSADGKRIASASEDTTLKIWDASTGRETRTLVNLKVSPPRTLAFTPDSKWILSGVQVWDVDSGREVLTLQDDAGGVSSLDISPDGKRIATGGMDQRLRIWDLATGKLLRTLKGHTHMVSAVAFSPDGKQVVSGSWDTTLKVWDVETGRDPATLQGHTYEVNSVVWSPDGKWIVSGGADRTIKVWVNGKAVLTLPAHAGGVTGVAFSPDGRRLASASQDRTVKVWELATRRQLATLKGHSNHVTSVAFSPDGKQVVSGSDDRTVKVWNLRTGDLTARGYWAALSPDGKRIVSAAMGHVGIWNADTGAEIIEMRNIEGVKCLTFSPDGTRILSAHIDQIMLWDSVTGKELFTLKGHANHLDMVAFSPDGQRVVSASLDHTLKIWDLRTRQPICTLSGHTHIVRCVAWSHDGTRIVSGSWDKSVRVWDSQTGQAILTLPGHDATVTNVLFSADDRRLVSSSEDRTVRLWDLETTKTILLLKGHGQGVTSIALSPDGKRIVSGSLDGTMKVWDVDTGQEVLTLNGHNAEVSNLTFSSEGKRIVSSSYDQTVKIWETEIREADRAHRFQIWQQRQARDFEKKRDWFAAAFHLNAMLEREPENTAAKARWDRALAELTRQDPQLATRVSSTRGK